MVKNKLEEAADAATLAVPRRAVLAAASTLVAAAAPAPADAPNTALVRTALECSGTGELCLQHCYSELAKGQTMLAQCAARVSEMIPVCGTLASLAAQESPHLPAYAKVCIDVCKSCQEECVKHEAHAEICKQCGDACAKVIAALQRFA